MSAIISNNTQGSTEATQVAVKADLDSIVTNTTGSATAANQTTGNTSLSSVVTNTALLSTTNSTLATIATNTGNAAQASSFIHTDTLSTATNGVSQDVGVGNLVKTFAIVAKGTGAAPTTLALNLEVSLDSTNWTVLLTVNQANDGIITSTGDVLFPARYFRCDITSLTLGGASNIVVTIAAMK